MNDSLNSVAFRIRLLFLTALISMLGIVFLAQFSDSSSYNDDTPRLRIAEIQEVTGDTEPPQDGPPQDDLLSSILFICAGFVVLSLILLSEVFPRLSFLSHVRPRSPPQL